MCADSQQPFARRDGPALGGDEEDQSKPVSSGHLGTEEPFEPRISETKSTITLEQVL